MNANLGALEELILLLVLKESKTYGAALVQIYVDHFNKEITLPAVVMVLKRLVKKGLLKSHMGEPSATRGGRRKKLYEPTQMGYQLAKDSMAAKNDVWKMVPKIS